MADKKHRFTLADNSEQEGLISGEVTIDGNWVDIGIDGFKSAGGNDAISLELYEGRLMLSVWSDSNKEDATQSIDLTQILQERVVA